VAARRRHFAVCHTGTWEDDESHPGRVERAANDPLPLDGRRKRIVQLKAEIGTLQRQAFALGANDYATPPEIILGVKVRREAVKKAETRRNTRAA
jgi:hypothetical protein